MSDKASLLAELRDIHEPPAPETIAPWQLILIAIVLLCAICLILVRRKRSHTIAKEARQTISKIRLAPADNRLLQLATLLRQLVYHREGTKVNRLQGQQWLEKLDEHFATHYFTKEAGTVFGDALYAPAKIENEQTLSLCDDIDKLLTHYKVR